MSFKSGSQIMQDFIEGIEEVYLEPRQAVGVYKAIIEALRNHDWDCEDEHKGQDVNYDQALRELNAG